MSEPDIITRLSLPSEAAEIYDMQLRLADETHYRPEDFHLSEETVRNTLTDPQQSRYYSALRREELVGMILCHRIPFSWRGNSGVYVEDLYVSERFRRGLGVGTFLMARACEWAIDLAGGVNQSERAYVRLDTDLGNWNADTRAFYESSSIGYCKATKMMHYRLYGQAVSFTAGMLAWDEES